jgi:hypothetical protein
MLVWLWGSARSNLLSTLQVETSRQLNLTRTSEMKIESTKAVPSFL